MSKIKYNKAAEIQTTSCHSSRPSMTRRDFIVRTAGATANVMFAPSVLSLLSSVAYGACGDEAIVAPVPFICVDLGGGGNLAGSNVMVGGQGGQEDVLPEYGSLGIGSTRAPVNPGMTSTLVDGGLQFHVDSAFFAGLANELSPEARAKVDGSIFCARSSDDTNTNPHSPLYWIARAQLAVGVRGELTNLVGTANSASGGRAAAPARSIDPAFRPVVLNSPADAQNLVNVGLLPNWLAVNSSDAKLKERANRVLASVNRMSSYQLDRFSQLDLPGQVKALVDCGYLKSSGAVNKYLGNNAAIDPAADPIFQQAFDLSGTDTTINGIARSGVATDRVNAAAGIAKLVLGGMAGAGTITYGGYDYHANDRNVTDNRDLEAGHVVGALINAAAAVGKDLMIYIFTDGGLSSDPSQQDNVTIANTGITNIAKPRWVGDNGTKSSAILLVYRHAGFAKARKHQIGSYNPNAAVDAGATLISNNVENLSKAVVANYLSLYGKEGMLQTVVGDNPFGTNLSQYLAFSKLR